MARRKPVQGNNSKVDEIGAVSPLHWSLWILAGGLWIFVATALVSFSSADWPSHLVAVHNEPVSNLCGTAGGWVAYWFYRLLGLSSWLVIIGTGLWLVMRAAGHQYTQTGLRLAGLLVMAMALAGLHALLLPNLGLMPGAPAGLIAHAATGCTGSVVLHGRFIPDTARRSFGGLPWLPPTSSCWICPGDS